MLRAIRNERTSILWACCPRVLNIDGTKSEHRRQVVGRMRHYGVKDTLRDVKDSFKDHMRVITHGTDVQVPGMADVVVSDPSLNMVIIVMVYDKIF